MNPSSMGMMGGMGMNPMQMMNPAMMAGMAGDMNMFGGQGMPAMGMGAMGMPGMAGGMGMPGMGGPGAGGPMGGGPGGPGGPMGGPEGDGKFYKTKICHKFMEGKCNYGPTCKYAHGESDLRIQGRDGGQQQQQQQARNSSGKVMTPHGPSAGMMPAMGSMGSMGAPGMMPMGSMGGPGMGGPGMGGPGMGMGPMGGMAGPGMGMGMGMGPKPPAAAAAAAAAAPGGGGGGGGDKSQHWRTRLCDQFMKEGQCRYGANCTFAHGEHQLQKFSNRGGGGNRGNQGGGGGGQKRALDGQGGGGGGNAGGGGGAEKRQRLAEPVVPPDHEALPVEGVAGASLDHVRARFQELVQEANRFARDTGHTVALFTVGGVFSAEEDTTDMTGEAYLTDIKSKDNTQPAQGMKVAVLKYGTGGVARQLVTRGEIVKFVSARGSKALAEMHAHAQDQNASA